MHFTFSSSLKPSSSSSLSSPLSLSSSLSSYLSPSLLASFPSPPISRSSSLCQDHLCDHQNLVYLRYENSRINCNCGKIELTKLKKNYPFISKQQPFLSRPLYSQKFRYNTLRLLFVHDWYIKCFIYCKPSKITRVLINTYHQFLGENIIYLLSIINAYIQTITNFLGM